MLRTTQSWSTTVIAVLVALVTPSYSARQRTSVASSFKLSTHRLLESRVAISMRNSCQQMASISRSIPWAPTMPMQRPGAAPVSMARFKEMKRPKRKSDIPSTSTMKRRRLLGKFAQSSSRIYVALTCLELAAKPTYVTSTDLALSRLPISTTRIVPCNWEESSIVRSSPIAWTLTARCTHQAHLSVRMEKRDHSGHKTRRNPPKNGNLDLWSQFSDMVTVHRSKRWKWKWKTPSSSNFSRALKMSWSKSPKTCKRSSRWHLIRSRHYWSGTTLRMNRASSLKSKSLCSFDMCSSETNLRALIGKSKWNVCSSKKTLKRKMQTVSLWK